MNIFLIIIGFALFLCKLIWDLDSRIIQVSFAFLVLGGLDYIFDLQLFSKNEKKF